MKCLFTLLTLIISVAPSLACETLFVEHSEAINKTQANQLLNNTLLLTDRPTTSSHINVTENLSQINCYLSSHLKPEKTHAALIEKFQSSLQQLANQFNVADTDIEKRAVINTINQQVIRDAGTGFVLFPTDNDKPIQINLFYTLIDQYCQIDASINCTKTTELAQNLWHIAGEYRALSDHLNKADVEDSLAFNQNLDQQWRSYKKDTIPLWPQEVLLNSVMYKPSKNGVSAPPSYKLLSLRPSIGLSYLSDQSHRIQPTINIDLLGVYWWQYDDDNQATSGRGLSASLIWDGDTSAYGISYHHTPKWSFTIANSDDNDLVLSMSFQVAHWLLNK